MSITLIHIVSMKEGRHAAVRGLPPPSGLLPASRRHSRAPTRESMPLADGPPTTAGPSPRHPPLPPPPSGLLPRGGGLRWGQPRALGPRGDPSATSAPPPNASQPLPCLLKPAPEPVEGGLRDSVHWRTGPPPRFTSKCRKMSQNVALFQPSTRKSRDLRVKNLTIWAHSRPFWPISVQFLRSASHA